MSTTYLPSSSIIITVAWPGSPTGTEDELMMRIKLSSFSVMPSLVIETVKEILVNPAGNSILYGPEP